MLYDINNYLKPYWQGDIMYDESCFVFEDEKGVIRDLTLLYKPEEIISVFDSSLTVKYEEGKDYCFENGALKAIKGGKIPALKYSDYYLNEKVEGKCFERRDGGFLAFREYYLMYPHQVLVTYRHNDSWIGYAPPMQGDKLKRALKKLEEKKPFKLLVYGDSISAGANSSGLQNENPHLPRWSNIIQERLKEKYGYEDIELFNPSVGGKDVHWGNEGAYENAAVHKPDLAIIAFGMNNVSSPLPYYKRETKSIMDIVLKENPDCDIILVAPMLPNEELLGFWGNQKYQQYPLYELEQEYDCVAVANMTKYHESLLEHKKFWDMTGNNVNHPNDFLIRGYAQVILKTLEK
ncbi:MAG: SGNH/GDSL hydrolase family protein [Bacillota bacterium]|nr:SGNH/GDSL hydrolase family protein [Bacillota bacterium]